MPEISEVARTVHFVRKFLVGKTISKCYAVDDANVFGKVGTSGAEFEAHLTGRKIIGAGQQGKYFWLTFDKAPHAVLHYGMAGWLEFKSKDTHYYRKKEVDENEQWPPKHWKFHLQTKPEKEGDEIVEAAFVDMRRFGRIRLVDCPGDKIREYSPLKENGPDPVQDEEKVTVEWLEEKCASKKVPIKAVLLDQRVISGIGNWVGDEIMFHARLHPEQYSNTLNHEQIERLHKSIKHICGTAVNKLGDSEQFPNTWLFSHRWGKGKKAADQKLPSGEKIQFLTVGGRTSAVVPVFQINTGPVSKDYDEAVEEYGKIPTALAEKIQEYILKREAEGDSDSDLDEDYDLPSPKKRARSRKAPAKKNVEVVNDEDSGGSEDEPALKFPKSGRSKRAPAKETARKKAEEAAAVDGNAAAAAEEKPIPIRRSNRRRA